MNEKGFLALEGVGKKLGKISARKIVATVPPESRRACTMHDAPESRRACTLTSPAVATVEGVRRRRPHWRLVERREREHGRRSGGPRPTCRPRTRCASGATAVRPGPAAAAGGRRGQRWRRFWTWWGPAAGGCKARRGGTAWPRAARQRCGGGGAADWAGKLIGVRLPPSSNLGCTTGRPSQASAFK